MGIRSAPRWKTRFGRFIANYGVERLSIALGGANCHATPKAIHEWLAGRSLPRLDRAIEISRLSRGRVTVEDIHRHRETVRR